MLWRLLFSSYVLADQPAPQAGTEIVTTHLSPEKADYSRNALAKTVYNRMFLRIVRSVNKVREDCSSRMFFYCCKECVSCGSVFLV